MRPVMQIMYIVPHILFDARCSEVDGQGTRLVIRSNSVIILGNAPQCLRCLVKRTLGAPLQTARATAFRQPDSVAFNFGLAALYTCCCRTHVVNSTVVIRAFGLEPTR